MIYGWGVWQIMDGCTRGGVNSACSQFSWNIRFCKERKFLGGTCVPTKQLMTMRKIPSIWCKQPPGFENRANADYSYTKSLTAGPLQRTTWVQFAA